MNTYQVIDEKNWERAMPWLTYTHISHTNSGKKDNATPLFDWGKYYEKDGLKMWKEHFQPFCCASEGNCCCKTLCNVSHCMLTSGC